MSKISTEYDLIQKILNATQQDDIHHENNISLLSGLAGRLLFHWYASKSSFLDFDADKFQLQLEQLTEQSALLGNTINFGYGISGFGWLMEVLLSERDDGYDPHFNQDIENLLTLELDKSQQWSGDIEYVLGLSGIAIFAARRLKQGCGLALYELIVKHFKELAVYDTDESCSWQVPPRSIYRLNKKHPDGPEYNLGLAHGVPAIICALLPAVKHPDVALQARKLISDGCNWLIKQKLAANSAISSFSYCAGDQQPSRLAWCYGDLTIALTFARAGQALDRQDLLDFACDLGIHASQRREDTAMVHDAGLCHGSAGLMLIFQLLNQIIPKPEFIEASDYWLENTLTRYEAHGIKGLYAYKSGEYVLNTGLLEGLSGIGLCLLARQGVSPDWADALLLA